MQFDSQATTCSEADDIVLPGLLLADNLLELSASDSVCFEEQQSVHHGSRATQALCRPYPLGERLCTAPAAV